MGLMQRSLLAAAAATIGLTGSVIAAEPKSGGVLNYVVGSRQPSFDGHQESTFGVIHPIAPFYSLLIKVNPAKNDARIDRCRPQRHEHFLASVHTNTGGADDVFEGSLSAYA